MKQKAKSIFSFNSDISKNAYMNWRFCGNNIAENLVVLENGFESAAKQLMKSILDDNTSKQADVLIFPIVYAIDHSIELYLKAIICNLEQLQTEKSQNWKTHDIRKLFNTMVSLISKEKVDKKMLEERISPLKEYIDELYSYITDKDEKEKEKKEGKPQMDFARYPFDTERNPYFYVCATNNVVIDIENLLSRYSDIMERLEGIYLMYEVELEERITE